MSQQEHSAPTPSLLNRLTTGRVAIGVALIAFLLYMMTLNPSFGFVDKGEMAAVASTLGIAHPTGYPTIMLLGWLFTKLLPVREAYALNILSAMLTAAGAAVMTLLFDYLLARFEAAKREGSRRERQAQRRGKESRAGGGRRKGTTEPLPELHEGASAASGRALLAGLAALFTALTATWWNQGNGFEVYSLHALMLPLVTLLFLRYVDAEHDKPLPELRSTKTSVWFAIMLGLSFTNHLTTILLAPAFLVYYFWRFGFRWATLKALALLAPWFVVGLLPYLWLPIRASMVPRFNWGDPATLKTFIDHITGKQYRVWMFTNPDSWRQQSAFFFSNLPSEVAFAGLALVALGIIFLGRRSPIFSVFTALLFVFCIIWAGGYDIMEIGPYYMTAVFAIGFWCLAGLAYLQQLIGLNKALAIGGALVVLNGAVNYSAADESRNTLVEDMTVNMLTTLPQNALVLSGQWDFWVAGSFYMQAVENMRPDVTVVDPELLRRSWYVRELQKYQPEFMATVAPETERYMEQIYKFEHGLPYLDQEIEATYVAMIRAMLDRNVERRPVCVTGEVRPDFSQGYNRIPYYLTLRLSRSGDYLPIQFPQYRFSRWDRIDGYTSKIYDLYARSAMARMLYERKYGRDSLALQYADLALSFDPGVTPDRIPTLPLNSEEQVLGMIQFFNELRRAVGR